MKSELELEFETRIRRGERTHEIVQTLLSENRIQSAKQPLATLNKWSSRGWWDWGTSIESGWFTHKHPRGPSW